MSDNRTRTPDSNSPPEVHHRASANRFTVRLDDRIAYLAYDQVDETTLDYAHVFVPPEHRNRGIAAVLTHEALEYARTAGLNVVPSCPYVRAYVRAHPEYEGLTVR